MYTKYIYKHKKCILVHIFCQYTTILEVIDIINELGVQVHVILTQLQSTHVKYIGGIVIMIIYYSNIQAQL